MPGSPSAGHFPQGPGQALLPAADRATRVPPGKRVRSLKGIDSSARRGETPSRASQGHIPVLFSSNRLRWSRLSGAIWTLGFAKALDCVSRLPTGGCVAKRYQLPLGGRHSEPRCAGVQSQDADNSPGRALGAPGLPGKWICSLPPWHAPWASRAAQTCRECLHWGNRSRSDSGLGLEFPGDPRELTQRLCGPVRPSPPSEVFSSCTGNNESETQKCQQSLRIPHIALIAGTGATPSLLGTGSEPSQAAA